MNAHHDEVDGRKSPKALPKILFNVFVDRFCTAGISAILPLYFNLKLGLDSSSSSSLFHIHEFLGFFFTIVGAIIADSWLGHYKTILGIGFLYAGGSAMIALGNIDVLDISIQLLTLIGLMLMITGAGSLRVNLNVFGANQYKLPKQLKQLSYYFSMHYLILNCGSVLGRLVTPILRQDINCFGRNDCYSIAFGVTALMMLVGMIVLKIGNSSYVKKPPSGNMLVNIFKCILKGISGKFEEKFKGKTARNHWLDHADEKYGIAVVSDTKAVVNILVLYIPLPIYWAVYMQQGSRWIFQAAKMNGDLWFYTVKPDQMLIFNSISSIAMIPVCDNLLYPMMAKIGLKTLLHKMTIGGVLAGIAFLFSAIIQLIIDRSYIHMMWLVPQHIVMALSENFLYISCLSFSYNEAPSSMKSSMQAFSFITMALGNLIAAIKLFKSPATELFFFAGVLFFNQVIFGYLASRYKYVNSTSVEHEDKDDHNDSEMGELMNKVPDAKKPEELF